MSEGEGRQTDRQTGESERRCDMAFCCRQLTGPQEKRARNMINFPSYITVCTDLVVPSKNVNNLQAQNESEG